jgi:hypothetical protein
VIPDNGPIGDQLESSERNLNRIRTKEVKIVLGLGGIVEKFDEFASRYKRPHWNFGFLRFGRVKNMNEIAIGHRF